MRAQAVSQGLRCDASPVEPSDGVMELKSGYVMDPYLLFLSHGVVASCHSVGIASFLVPKG